MHVLANENELASCSAILVVGMRPLPVKGGNLGTRLIVVVDQCRSAETIQQRLDFSCARVFTSSPEVLRIKDMIPQGEFS